MQESSLMLFSSFFLACEINTSNVNTKFKSNLACLIDALVVFSCLYWLITRLPTASTNEIVLYFIGGVAGFLLSEWMKRADTELDD